MFEARYTSSCAGCPDDIEPGEAAKYVDDILFHVDCAPTPPRPDNPVCPECFIITPCECAA